jgi:hypothetical protein
LSGINALYRTYRGQDFFIEAFEAFCGMFWNIGGKSITLQSFEAEVQRKCEVSKGKSTA